MNQPICSVCNGEMRLIPAGVSKKSGKPYDSFWGCKTYGCKGSIKIVAPQPTYAPQSAPQTPTGYARAENQIQNNMSANINKFESRKEEAMKTMAAGRDATLLVTAEMAQGQAWSEEDIKKRIIMYKEFMYKSVYNVPAGIS